MSVISSVSRNQEPFSDKRQLMSSTYCPFTANKVSCVITRRAKNASTRMYSLPCVRSTRSPRSSGNQGNSNLLYGIAGECLHPEASGWIIRMLKIPKFRLQYPMCCRSSLPSRTIPAAYADRNIFEVLRADPKN